MQERPDLLAYYTEMFQLDIVKVELVNEVLIAISKVYPGTVHTRLPTYDNQKS
jgi:hypothetical protein